MYINVLIETKVKSNDMTFTYHVPDDMLDDNLIGKRVLIPFSNRIIEGFVIKYSSKPEDYIAKDIIKIIDEEPVLNEELLNLGKVMSQKYLCSLIYAYQAMLPKALKANHKSSKKYLTKTYVMLNNKDINTNDIITFKNEDNELITHRIMEIDGDKLVTKGDANNTEDKTITKDAVIGKVISVYPRLGIWAKVFTDSKVLISVFITLILIGLAISKDEKIQKG